MANHSTGKLPWAVDPALMALFAKEAMQAAFGGYYLNCPEEFERGQLEFKQAVTGYASSCTLVWSEGPRHVESRHSLNGLDQVAQTLEFEALCSCFGAPTAFDDGQYQLDRPGKMKLLSKRMFSGGLSLDKTSSANGGAATETPWYLEKTASADGGAAETLWYLTQEQQSAAKSLLDPIFFDPPAVSVVGVFAPGPKRDKYLRAKELDILEWGSKLDWGQAVERAYPKGEGMDAKIAASALLPSAALGQPCPAQALAKASAAGLERALAVALMWSNAAVAQEIHGRLRERSKDMDASEAKAKSLSDSFLARRSKASRDEGGGNAAQASQAVFEALTLSRQSKPAEADAQRNRMGL